MRLRGIHFRNQRTRCAGLVLCIVGALSGCASTYMGISLKPGRADAELQGLARKAKSGDERAQLELGTRYEQGIGVPLDLAKAATLYFDAASRTFNERIVIAITNKGRATYSFIRTVPVRTEVNGLSDALIRWHRLLPSVGEITEDRRSFRTRAFKEKNAVIDQREDGRKFSADIEDASEIAAIEQYAALNFGYHPVFNELKSGGRDWRHSISAGDAVSLVSSLTVEQSLLLLTQDVSPSVPGLKLDEKRAHTLCTQHLSRPLVNSADLRLFGICAVKQPKIALARFADAVTVSRLRLAQNSQVNLSYLSSAADVLFLYRVAKALGNDTAADALETSFPSIDGQLTRLVNSCTAASCSADMVYLLRRSDFVRTQVMLALVEHPGMLIDASDAQRERLRRFASRVTSDYPFNSTLSGAVCEPLGLSLRDCQHRYPFEPTLDQYVAKIVAAFVASTVKLPLRPSSACAALQRRVNALRDQFVLRPDLASMLPTFLRQQCFSGSQETTV